MRWFHKRNKNKKEVDAAPAPPTERRQQQPPKNDASKGPEEQAPSPQSVQPAPAPVNEPSTQIRSPFGPDAAMNEEIMEIWTQLQDRVAQIAIREGKPVKNGLEVDDVLETLDSSQQPDEKNPGKTEKVKKVFGHMLGLIRTVGGIVSNGASQVGSHLICVYEMSVVNSIRSLHPLDNVTMSSALLSTHGMAIRAHSKGWQNFWKTAPNIWHGWNTTSKEAWMPN